jgi:hypothetical protein
MAQEKKNPREADVTELPFKAVADPNPDDSVNGSNELSNVDHHIGPPATRKEIFSYYLYFAGNNGIGSFQ